MAFPLKTTPWFYKSTREVLIVLLVWCSPGLKLKPSPCLLMGKKGRAVRDASSFTRVPVQTFCQLGTLPLMATVITTVVKFLPSNTVRWGIKVST